MVLTLIRGLPGSGKSTEAINNAKYKNSQHIEADKFFIKNGSYIFNGAKLKDAHEWCQSQTKFYLNQGVDTVVCNTFTTLSEIKPYLLIAKKYQVRINIVECTGNYNSIHGVPDSTITKMKSRWEKIPVNFLN